MTRKKILQRYLFIHCILLISSSVVVQSGTLCPPRYHVLHDRLCYRFGNRPAVWTNANRACSRDGGSLIQLKDQVDIDNLRQIMSRSYSERGTAFIGLLDKGDGAGYSNLDESNIKAAYWEGDIQPTPQQFGDPRCAFVRMPGEGRWESGACGVRRRYLCTYVPDIVKTRNTVPKRIRCHICNGARTNEACNAQGTVLCPYNARSCQNEVRVVNGRKTITKRCKQTRACQNNFLQNSKAMWLEAQCKPGRRAGSSVCRCCCQGDHCNAAELPCLAKGCGPLRVPNDGEIKCTDEYMVGSLCTFTCDFGFNLSGSKATRCNADEKWTSPVPQCLRAQCEPIAAPDSGSISCTDKNFGSSTCRFKCNYGYYLRGLSITTCLGTREWSVDPPTCHAISCSPLEVPENGRILVKNPPVFGRSIAFACNEQYVLTGNPIVRCTDRNMDGVGDWTSEPPSCKLVTCSAMLRAPDNGKITLSSELTSLGTVASFECESGYILKGNNKITCDGPTEDGNGKWSANEPTCEEILACPSLSRPINGEPIRSTSASPRFGTMLTFSCKFGYFLIGSKRSVCGDKNGDGKGEWSERPPTCKQILCFPNLKASANSRFLVNAGNTFSASNEFSCVKGYFLIGKPTVTCLDENNDGIGEWSNEQPTCRKVVCKPFIQPNNGAMVCTNENDYGTNCVFSCDLGFHLTGSKNSVCEDRDENGSGEWTNPVPTCTQILCPTPPPPPSNGKVTCSDESFVGSECEFTCDGGYWLKDTAPSVCQSNGRNSKGKWSKSTPVCHEILCDASQSAPDFGFISCNNENRLGSNCLYSCREGYHLSGATSVDCLDLNNDGQGEWDNPKPTCKKSSCEPGLVKINSGTTLCNDTSFYGSVCEFKCDAGFELSGNSAVSCGEPRDKERATWSGDSPICIIRHCDEIPATPGGDFDCSNGTMMGSRCAFKCDDVRYMNGDAIRICVTKDNSPGSDVYWNNPAPACELITCPSLIPTSPQLEISCTDERLSLRTICTFDCGESYSLNGEVETECSGPVSKDSGKWTTAPPICTRIRCEPESQNPVNGTVECSDQNFHKSICKYECDPEYNMIGNGERICQDDLSWNNLEPTCERMSCDLRQPPENGIMSCSNQNYVGSICHSFCDLGYDMRGRVESRCILDDDGIAKYTEPLPTCDPIYCDKIDGPIEGGVILCGVDQGDVESNRYDTTCYLSCNDGWRAEGATRTTCVGFGDWDDMIGRCERIICRPPLATPPKGIVSCSNNENTPGTICEFSCTNGLKLDGSNVVTCSAEGKWSAEPPACVSR